eukprot:1161268-Pelagomonas_calceolata.AAC.8
MCSVLMRERLDAHPTPLARATMCSVLMRERLDAHPTQMDAVEISHNAMSREQIGVRRRSKACQ